MTVERPAGQLLGGLLPPRHTMPLGQTLQSPSLAKRPGMQTAGLTGQQ
jgi:hypothetical protein